MKRILLAAFPLLMIAGCADRSGGEYLGKWTRQITNRQASFTGGERVDVIRDTLTIERNGDGFLLRTARTLTQGVGKPTSYPEVKTPAVLKDGQLHVAGGLGAYVIEKSKGHLVTPDGQGDFTKAS